MEQHPEEFVMVEGYANDVEVEELVGEAVGEPEITKEPTLLDRISGWFTEDIH